VRRKYTLPRQNYRRLLGQKRGPYTLIRFDQIVSRRSYWLCRCECGREVRVSSDTLRNAAGRLCSHRSTERHGLSRLREYRVWKSMHARCRDLRDPCYGGRGIRVCDRWRSFTAFLQDMGVAPSASHTLDRIDNDRGYEPGNVRWATRREQSRNTRQVRLITFAGATRSISEWAKVLGVSPSGLSKRLRRGVPPEVVLRKAVPDEPPRAILPPS
jgi:hypothetical protein